QSPACEYPQSMPSAWAAPRRINARQTRPFTALWESCDSIRPEDALDARSPLNPLGLKGVGEGGCVAPPAAIANAVSDARSPFGIEINSTPVRPEGLLMRIRAIHPR